MLNELVRSAYSLFAVLGLPADDPGLVIWVGLIFGVPLFILVVFIILDFVHRLTGTLRRGSPALQSGEEAPPSPSGWPAFVLSFRGMLSTG